MSQFQRCRNLQKFDNGELPESLRTKLTDRTIFAEFLHLFY
ncbi:hypothetical protein LEP1GSC008_3203 [Leptospira kirschneri serovar Bulgarica str. Nikolaevo]|uniref:Uncharacterized protein n=1 Tax=Leptospira kirschneri serovar Bulgarica str. Nikolaevo TaxID=1240687 RepID=M6FLE6_9LEPT|nr:hypothetical protein LEP1GSC008_3203 [Leptospira kirschneri serovar Bulgarica str. Nikolaevo]